MARKPVSEYQRTSDEQPRLPTDRRPVESLPRATFEWRLVLRSFRFAFAGIGWMLRSQRNAQVHLVITIVVIIAGVVFRVSVGEWLALLLSITLVLAFEAINTAVEAIVDLASPQYHPLAKVSKDAAAGAVLITAIGAALVGLIIFVPRFFALIL